MHTTTPPRIYWQFNIGCRHVSSPWLPLFFPLINYYFTTIQSSSAAAAAAAAVNARISSSTTNDQSSWRRVAHFNCCCEEVTTQLKELVLEQSPQNKLELTLKWMKKWNEWRNQSNNINRILPNNTYSPCVRKGGGEILMHIWIQSDRSLRSWKHHSLLNVARQYLNLLYRNRRPTLIERTMEDALIDCQEKFHDGTKSIRCGCRELDKRETWHPI